MKTVWVAIISIAVLLFTMDLSFAQTAKNGGWGPGTSYGRLYNPSTVEIITGQVQKIEKIRPQKGMSYGIHLIVKTARGPIDVHLGPEWYISKQNIRIKPGDTVRITGSRVILKGKPVIIASEVKKGQKTLALRDRNGIPLWSGRAVS